MVGYPPADAEQPAARAWLVHPVTVFALVVLVVNDHVLKARLPGLVTGKLSDVAGLVVAPPLLAVVVVVFVGPLRARAVAFAAIAATGVGFAAVKAVPAVALIASGVWSAASGPSIILADRSDLTALPALGVAAWVSTRSGGPKRFGVGRAERPARLAEPSGRTPRALGQRLHRIGVLIVLPVAALALVATSAPTRDPYAATVGVWRGMAVVGDDNGQVADLKRWRVSEDGARTWRHLTPDEADAWSGERSTLSLQAQVACAPALAARCYRVVPGHLRVEQSDDGGASWRVSWEVPDPRRDYLARTYDGLTDVHRDLSSLAVAVVPTSGGDVVVVANGRDGYAVRDIFGYWERVGFGRTIQDNGAIFSDLPQPLDADALDHLAPELIAGLLVGLIAIGAGAWAATRRRRRALVVVFAAALGASALVALLATAGLHDQDRYIRLLSGGTAGIGAVIAVIGSLGALLTATATGALAARWAALIAVIGAVVAGTYGALFASWSHGTLGYRGASLIAVAVAIAGIALAARLGMRLAR